MPDSEDYLKKGTICKCRHCQTTVEITEVAGMLVEYKAVEINDIDTQQQLFAIFLIDFEKVNDDSVDGDSS